MLKNGDFIETLLDAGHIKNSSYKNINANSLNLTLANEFKTFDYEGGNNISFKEPHKVKYHIHKSKYSLKPQGFVLTSSVEFFRLPNNIKANLTMRSSAGRLGLNHFEWGLIESEFCGQITFELKNEHPIFKPNGQINETCLELFEGLIAVQVEFEEVEPVSKKYGYAKNGNYMNQTGVTISRGIK